MFALYHQSLLVHLPSINGQMAEGLPQAQAEELTLHPAIVNRESYLVGIG